MVFGCVLGGVCLCFGSCFLSLTFLFETVMTRAAGFKKKEMGLRKGNTVLIHYRRGSDLYQSVLIMQDADLKQGKVSPEQHKYWRYVLPVRSYFDWLPEKIANIFCSTALDAFAGKQYGELEH